MYFLINYVPIISADFDYPVKFQRILHLFITETCTNDNSLEFFITLFISAVTHKLRVCVNQLKCIGIIFSTSAPCMSF
jgi:hypothetical protein